MNAAYKQQGVRANVRRYGALLYKGGPAVHGFMWVDYGEGGHRAMRRAAARGLITDAGAYIRLLDRTNHPVRFVSNSWRNLIPAIRREFRKIENRNHEQ